MFVGCLTRLIISWACSPRRAVLDFRHVKCLILNINMPRQRVARTEFRKFDYRAEESKHNQRMRHVQPPLHINI